MPQLFKYPTSPLLLSDYIIGTVSSQKNLTRNFKANQVVSAMLHALGIGTVTSISTASSKYIDTTGGVITTTGTISMALSATGLGATTAIKETQYLRGDGTWDIAGIAASKLEIKFNGATLTSNVSSINFTGNSDATAAGFNIAVDMPGIQDSVDKVTAGTAISISPITGIGVVQIANDGAILAKAGGFITLSGGTGAVIVNTTKNAGTVTVINQGVGIDAITNNTSNAGIAVEYSGINNYIDISELIVPITEVDIIIYNQISSSNVKTTRIGNIDQSDLVLIKKDIDDNDAGVIKNSTDNNYEVSRTKNMVSCTSTEYNQLVVAGTTDQNTLYFIVGAGQSFTVNPSVVNNAGGVLGQDYTLSVTPSSFTGILGTSYTFTVTLNIITGSFAGTNPQSVTDTVSNPGGGNTSYNKTINFNGTWTAGATPTYQSQLSITKIGTINTAGTKDVDWRFKVGNSQPGDISSATVNGAYSFNPIVELINTNKHAFTAGEPIYQTAVGSVLVAQPTYTVFSGADTTNSGIVQQQVQKIQANYALRLYSANLTVDVSNITITGSGAGTPSYIWSLASNAATNNQQASIDENGGIIVNAITNMIDGTVFSWTNPSTPAIGDTNYTWSSAPSFVFNPVTPQTISGGNNGSATLTITGTIIYAPATFGIVKYVSTSTGVTYTNGATASDWVELPTSGTDVGPVATGSAYAISPDPPTATPNANFSWTSGPTITNTTPAIFLSRTVAQGGMPYTNSPATNDSTWTIAGNLSGIAAINPTFSSLKLTAAPIVGVQVTYTVEYQWVDSSNTTQSQTKTLTAPSASPYVINLGPFTISNLPVSNNVTAIVNRTGPSTGGQSGNQSSGKWTIDFKLNGTSIGGDTGVAGSTVSAITKQYSGITSTSDYLEVIIQEDLPVLYTTTLDLHLNVAGTEYTLTGDITGSVYSLPENVEGTFNITAPANTCYPTQGCNYHWLANNNNPVLSLTAGGASITNPVTYTQPASNQTLNIYLSGTIAPDPVMTLNYVNNIVGAPTSPGGTPQPLPDTSGLYTLAPGPVATVNAGGLLGTTWQAPAGDPWYLTVNDAVLVTATTNYAFTTTSPFAFTTQAGSYELWDNAGIGMPVSGGTSVQILTGQVVREYADIKLEQNSLVSTSRFQATFAATVGATRSLVPNAGNCSSLPCTITSSNYDAGLMTGNAGQVTITVLKTTNGGITQSSGSILYGDGTTKNFNNNVNTATDPAFSHTIASLASLVNTAIYSASVDES